MNTSFEFQVPSSVAPNTEDTGRAPINREGSPFGLRAESQAFKIPKWMRMEGPDASDGRLVIKTTERNVGLANAAAYGSFVKVKTSDFLTGNTEIVLAPEDVKHVKRNVKRVMRELGIRKIETEEQRRAVLRMMNVYTQEGLAIISRFCDIPERGWESMKVKEPERKGWGL